MGRVPFTLLGRLWASGETSQFLGAGILRLNGRARRKEYPGVHQEPRARRPDDRPTQHVQQVATSSGSKTQTALSGSQHQASNFAGGLMTNSVRRSARSTRWNARSARAFGTRPNRLDRSIWFFQSFRERGEDFITILDGRRYGLTQICVLRLMTALLFASFCGKKARSAATHG